jgi:hypothetical protein
MEEDNQIQRDSKMQKIKEYIETCPLLDGDKINVDYLDDEIYSYSIDRTPTQPEIKQFIDGRGGKYQIAFDFTVTAPISSRVVTNLANSKFGEDFMEWIKTQNRLKNFPKINGAFSIKCTSPSYILQKTETTAIYIIQINFTYYEY